MLAVVGIVVLIVAVVALRDPRSGGSQNAGQSVGVSASSSPAAPSSTARSAARPTASTSGTASAPPVALGSSASAASASAASAAAAAAKSVPLVVLNNTTVSGLAATAAQRFENAGWTVTSSGNLTNDIISTCAYYDPDVSGAKAAAEVLQAQFPTIKRVAPKFSGLPSGPVVVVLTPDYQSN